MADDRRARPLQAAGSSALAFASGAILPLPGHKWMAHCDIGEYDQSAIMLGLDVRQ
jgi:hypothetical protein